MLDLKFIRENKEKVKEAVKNKNEKTDVDLILSLDEKRRSLLSEADELKHQKNVVTEKIAQRKLKE
jgi:seryl-tRNA synthetase